MFMAFYLKFCILCIWFMFIMFVYILYLSIAVKILDEFQDPSLIIVKIFQHITGT